MVIALRTDGKQRDKHPHEIEHGIVVRIQANGQNMQIQRYERDKDNPTPLASSNTFPLERNTTYHVEIVDEGSVIKALIYTKGVQSEVKWDDPVNADKDRNIAIHNREPGQNVQTSTLSNIVLKPFKIEK